MNYSVGCEQGGCFVQGKPEQGTAGNQIPEVSILQKFVFSPSEPEMRVRNGVLTQRGMKTGTMAGYHQRNTKQVEEITTRAFSSFFLRLLLSKYREHRVKSVPVSAVWQ